LLLGVAPPLCPVRDLSARERGARRWRGGARDGQQVEQGDTLSSVADKLEEAGVIGSATVFKLESRVQGGETEIKAGEYRFVPGEDSEQILETLSSGESVSAFTITVPEGLNLEQTARVVEGEGGIPAEEFVSAAARTDYGYDFLEDPAIRTTEGFLFPKKYEFERGVDARRSWIGSSGSTSWRKRGSTSPRRRTALISRSTS
jgi:cell division protein YceG involved in septum cleavage